MMLRRRMCCRCCQGNGHALLILVLLMMVFYTIWIKYSDMGFEHSIQNLPLYIEELRRLNSTTVKPTMVLPDDTRGKVYRSYCEVYDIDFPNDNEYKCIMMKTNPPAPICLYDIFQDMYISDNLDSTGLWEPYVLTEMADVLRRDPSLGVIDIGANIGVHTLLSAQMGHEVIAVEPFMQNILRLHKAAQLGNVTNKITVVHNAIADVRTGARIIQSGDNQGDTRIVLGVGGRCVGDCSATVTTIYMDDLLEIITFKKAIIKIDCQGYEHKAFRRARKLLDAIDIKYIFMEWLVMRDLYNSQLKRDKEMVEDLIKLLLHKGYRPYSLDVHGARGLDVLVWQDWPTDIVWRRRPNDREYTKLLQNHFKTWP